MRWGPVQTLLAQLRCRGKLTALIDYTREYVTERGQIRDRTHDSLSAYYDTETLVGVVMLAGFYVSLSHEVEALGLQRDGFVGWELDFVPLGHPRHR